MNVLSVNSIPVYDAYRMNNGGWKTMLENCTMCSLCNNLLAKRDNEKKVAAELFKSIYWTVIYENGYDWT